MGWTRGWGNHAMFRLLILLSLLALACALVVRWWFARRILDGEGRRACRADLRRWEPARSELATVQRSESTAADFGAQLRQRALAAWRERDSKAAAARANTLRFGMAVPPLSALVAVFALLVGKIPLAGALAIPLAATAAAAVLGILTLPPELAAIARMARLTRDERPFADPEDEDAVVRCAAAHAWEATLPPILRMLRR